MASDQPDGWLSGWTTEHPAALGRDLIAELASFGEDARRLGFTPTISGPSNDPTFALLAQSGPNYGPRDPALTYSWEIRLAEYDRAVDLNPLSVWLTDNVGNPALHDGPEPYAQNTDADPNGIVHIPMRAERE